jgi:DNA-binding NtrC family response regulator
MHETVANAPLAAAPEGALVARVIDGEDRGLAVVIEDAVLVGTSDACELKLRDPTVSRRHASLAPGAVGVIVRDAGSKNGVWLGAVAVREADVPVGTEVRVGSTTLRIEATVTAGARGATPALRHGFGRFVGEAPSLQRVYAALERAAPTDATILVEGESGTGKELLAEAIHEHGARRGGPFVIVDCGTMQETLVESELFGHEKGAFTGADRKHVGAFEAAQGGTVFLDEIGELPLALQTRLLRVLEQRHIKRVGGTARIPIDVRVVAATNRNLDKEVDEGRFRLDLFHRLAVVLVRVPPLRERRGDLERLARHFAAQHGRPDALTPAVLERIARHDWPGNVRELRNYVERVTLLGDAAEAIPARSGQSGFDAAASSGLPYRVARAQALDAFTDAYVASMLAAHDGNVSAAARAAGIARRYFQRLKG